LSGERIDVHLVLELNGQRREEGEKGKGAVFLVLEEATAKASGRTREEARKGQVREESAGRAT
jgi:hypothetical protein